MAWNPFRRHTLTEDEARERHNAEVARRGRGIMFLPTNVEAPDEYVVGGLWPQSRGTDGFDHPRPDR